MPVLLQFVVVFALGLTLGAAAMLALCAYAYSEKG